MKFHKLETLNLNSLYGEQAVDFDAVAGGAGMFLIHGPTGSGKSTLLDALCLALYGRTPRLGDTGKETADGIEAGASDDSASRVMSQGTGRCMARLELSVQDEQGTRRRYRASWSVKRAYEKPDGTFQKPYRKLEEWVNGEWSVIVDSWKVKDFEAPFETLLRGLTFVDFQRTVLLAQFKFREFLEADATARTAILERMTDSSVFREIGKRASEAWSRADQEFKRLELELTGTAPLTADARGRLENDLEEARAKQAAASAELGMLDGARTFWRGLQQAEGQLGDAHAAADKAAQQRREQASTLAALAEDTRLAPGRMALAEWTRCHEEATAHAAKVEAAKKEAEGAAELERAAQGVHAGKAEAHRAALLARTTQLPAVEDAEKAWAAAAQVQREAAQAKTRAEALSSEADRLGGEADNARTTLESRREALLKSDKALAAIPAAASLLAAEGKVAMLAANLSGRAQAVVQARKTTQSKRDAVGLHAAARGPKESHALGKHGLEDAARREEATAVTALRQLTGGRATGEFIQELEVQRDRLDVRLRQFSTLTQGLATRDTVARDVEKRTAEAAGAMDQLARASDRLSQCEAEVTRLALELAPVRDHVKSLDSLLKVLDHRDVLRPDQRCPVCGSEEHPYRVHPDLAPSVDAERARRKELGARLEVLEKAHEDARLAATQAGLEKAGLAERVSTLSQELQNKREELARSSRELDATAREAGLQAAEAGAAAGEAQRAEQQRQRIVETLTRVRTCESELTEARTALAEAEGNAKAAQHALELHEQQAAALATALEALEQDATERARAEAEARTALEAELAQLEVDGADPAAGAALVASRAAEVRSLQGARVGLQEAVRDALIEYEKAKASHLAAVGAASTAADEAANLALEADRLGSVARSHLAGVEPSSVRTGLNEAVEKAATALSAALEDLTAARLRAKALAADLVARDEHFKALETKAHAARALLDGAMRVLGISTEGEIEARSLADAARTAAEAVCTAIEHAERDAATLREAAEALRARLLAARPEGERADAVASERLPVLDAAATKAKEASDTWVRTVALHEKALADDDAVRAEHAGRAAELERARQDLAHWQVIQELVGTRKGEQFATVVQALNLQRVLGYANHHLARFMDRYELEQVIHVKNGPQLDFRVIDKQQQGAVRTLKGLSGGESFVVSLALALGLASMRSSRLRVETLLIDEGFGALDPQTLADAHHALEALQGAVGVQIGIISHVAYLKDKIGAQIEVKPDGAGRSRVFA